MGWRALLFITSRSCTATELKSTDQPVAVEDSSGLRGGALNHPDRERNINHFRVIIPLCSVVVYFMLSTSLVYFYVILSTGSRCIVYILVHTVIIFVKSQ